jgi:hypothetical protein
VFNLLFFLAKVSYLLFPCSKVGNKVSLLILCLMNKTGLFDKQQQLIEPKIIRPK